MASRTIGAGNFRLMFRHILPNAAGPISRERHATHRNQYHSGVGAELLWLRHSASHVELGADE